MRYPLQVEIATVFTVLIAVLGASLVYYNYSENREITLIAAQDLFARITRHTAANIRELYAPAEALVDLTAQLAAVEAETLAERQGLLNYFAEALRLSDQISSIYVGYEDGDMFLVRAIRGDDHARRAIGAPEGTQLAVQIVERPAGGTARQSFSYYESDLTLLGSSAPTATDFDPRARPWYRRAIATDAQVASGFYTFHTTGEVGTTIARRTYNGRAVVGADLTLRDLSVGLSQERITPTSEILVFNRDGAVVAHPELMMSAGRGAHSEEFMPRQRHLTELGHPVFETLYRRHQAGLADGQLSFSVDNRDWMGSVSTLPVRSGGAVHLAVLVPQDELLARINTVRTESVLISLALLLLAVAAGWWIAKRISRSLRTLASEAEQIRELKLDTPVTVRSRVIEIDYLAVTMAVMKSAIQRFVEISKALSAEENFDRLLDQILADARSVCNADGGSICLLTDDEHALELALAYNDRSGICYGGTSGRKTPQGHLPLVAPDGGPSPGPVEGHAVCTGEPLVVDDMGRDARFDFTFARQRHERDSYRCHSLLHLPLRNRQGEVMGLLELINARDELTDRVLAFKPETVSYVAALSSQAAIVLDNRRLLKAQKELLDSLIQLIAGAIDAKSAYTSGHCQRVPELAHMLAEAAHKSNAKPFEKFLMTDQERYELHMASWLHDCGKITTPEHVVDKATKLECIYNRIHEIRMRFEVLWRDAQIAHYKALAEGTGYDAADDQKLDAQLQRMREEFAFVADCNVGGEFMAEDRIARLKAIGSKTWLRHFDDRLGLSHEELARKRRTPQPQLPVTESVLADKNEHIVMREGGGTPFGDNPHGFRVEVPQYAFNHGELYNLSVARGTLTNEDRFKINEHIIQTIVLLNKLPFPKELRRVPLWAGNHHEKLDGTGYPRGLSASELSIPERIMAIADIFEALTASDRPYKKAKTLSESVRIMAMMRNDGHICPDLFDLFLSSGVYRGYAQKFLSPEQIDAVDISQFTSSA